MKRLIQIDIGNATETHCGDGGPVACTGENINKGKCRHFRKPLEFDPAAGECRRLPECIAAEVK